MEEDKYGFKKNPTSLPEDDVEKRAHVLVRMLQILASGGFLVVKLFGGMMSAGYRHLFRGAPYSKEAEDEIVDAGLASRVKRKKSHLEKPSERENMRYWEDPWRGGGADV